MIAWLLIIFAPIAVLGHGSSCPFDRMAGRTELRFTTNDNDPPGGFGLLSSTPWERFRIRTQVSDIDSVLNDEQQDFLRTNLLPMAVTYFELSLKVQRSSNALAFPRDCAVSNQSPCQALASTTTCGSAVVPEEMIAPTNYYPSGGSATTQPGCTECVRDADFVLFVTSTNGHGGNCDSGSTIAYASTCWTKSSNNRPVGGYINFCPAHVSTAESQYPSQLSTAVHEITHALVFANYLFVYFRNPSDGSPRTPRDGNGDPEPSYQKTFVATSACTAYSYYQPHENTMKQVTTSRGTTVWEIRTENVVAEARRYFGCPTMTGMELENTPTSECAWSGSHWEQRLLEQEFMSPVSSHDAAYSNITMALFKDSGWYQVSYEGSTPMHWGRAKGCPFVNDKCLTPGAPPQEPFPRHFCSEHGKQQCTVERKFKGTCLVNDYTLDIPVAYRYFTSDSRKGGYSAQSDYCPHYMAPLESLDCRFNSKDDSWWNWQGEVYGGKSRCFDSTLSQTITDGTTTYCATETAGGPCSNGGMASACYSVRKCDKGARTYEVGIASSSASSKDPKSWSLTWVSCDDGSAQHIFSDLGGNWDAGSVTCAPFDIVCDGTGPRFGWNLSAVDEAAEYLNDTNNTNSTSDRELDWLDNIILW